MNLYRSFTENNVRFGSLSQRTLLSSKQHIFSTFSFHLLFHNSFLGVPNLNFGQFISDDVVHRKLTSIHQLCTCCFPHCSFILLKQKTTPSHHPTPLKFTRNRTGKFTDLKVTWERPASVKPGKAIHDASWAKSSEASKGESLNVHRIQVTYI